MWKGDGGDDNGFGNGIDNHHNGTNSNDKEHIEIFLNILVVIKLMSITKEINTNIDSDINNNNDESNYRSYTTTTIIVANNDNNNNASS